MDSATYEDRYPVGRFILARAGELGLSRTDLVRLLHFTDLTDGHRALSGLMSTGVMPPQIGMHFVAALEIDDALARAVLAATERQRRDERRGKVPARENAYRSAFKPHLRVETARSVPSPIFVAAIIGVPRILNVTLSPEVYEATGEDRDRLVKRVILDHYDENRGRVPAFGEITGYALVTLLGYREVDFGFPYDVEGNPAGPMHPVERLGEATIEERRVGTWLTGRLNNIAIRAIRLGPGR